MKFYWPQRHSGFDFDPPIRLRDILLYPIYLIGLFVSMGLLVLFIVFCFWVVPRALGVILTVGTLVVVLVFIISTIFGVWKFLWKLPRGRRKKGN